MEGRSETLRPVGKLGELKETISMEVEKDENGNFARYKDSRAAKFAMLSAESGGINVLDQDPFFMNLVVSASLDNREKVQSSPGLKGREFGKFSEQDFKGYHAKVDKSYKDFSYGNDKRFNGNQYRQNLSLATVYNAMDQPVAKLTNSYSIVNAKNILYYSHKGGNPQKGREFFDVAIPDGKSNFFISVQGNKKYQSILDK